MNIKSAWIGAALAALLVSAGAVAATLVPGTMDAVTAGRLEGALAQCAKADEQHRASYEQLRADLFVFAEGTEYEVRTEASDTAEYRQAKAEVELAAAKANPQELLTQCRQFVPAQALNETR